VTSKTSETKDITVGVERGRRSLQRGYAHTNGGGRDWPSPKKGSTAGGQETVGARVVGRGQAAQNTVGGMFVGFKESAVESEG